MEFPRTLPSDPKLRAALEYLHESVACSGRGHPTTTLIESAAKAHDVSESDLVGAHQAYYEAEAAYWRAQFKADRAKPRVASKSRAMLLNDREIEITEVQGEGGEGAYAVAGNYIDTGAELTDTELDAVTESYQERLYEDFYQNQVARAEAWADAREDR